MPIGISFDDDVCVLTVTAPIGVDAMVEGYSQIFDHPEFRENVHALWDLSRLDLSKIPVGDIRQLPRQLRQFMARRGDDYKAAVVTTRTMDYQLLRMYLGILKLIGSNFRMKLFNDRESAFQWLRGTQ